jgi:peptidoglycan L-alanyl-D-glutamate endopeptidase CwlK
MNNLATCHRDLQDLFGEVVKKIDCTILEGHRDETLQNLAYEEGKSRLRYPESKHNELPSLAVDVSPYPIDWDDMDRWYFFAGYVQRTADEMGIDIRWGGDWDSDREFDDQTFNDLPHWELV